ncbi:MAG: ChbG/HpnK family deacetylase [Candidatus Moranbacteria bacterium]|nr:ChbG/HpnK family deacetylase [Candidatus Moranbacteria bacterium]
MELQTNPKKQIIVVADDFGLNEKANRNILNLVKLGKIDRVAIMSLGKISEKEITELLTSHIKLDIHLDILNEFDENKQKRSGIASRLGEFLLKVFSGKLKPSLVEKEWERQIETFKKKFGKNPDGINSHEHIHLFPKFFKITLKLKNKYAIPYVRFGDSFFAFHNKPVSHILHILRKINLKDCTMQNCVSSGHLVSLDWIENIEEFLKNLPQTSTEIVCHPEIEEDFEKIKKYF